MIIKMTLNKRNFQFEVQMIEEKLKKLANDVILDCRAHEDVNDRQLELTVNQGLMILTLGPFNVADNNLDNREISS